MHKSRFKLFKTHQFSDELLIELLKSERKRVLIILSIFIVGFIIMPIIAVFWPKLLFPSFVKAETIKFSIIWSILFFLFELAVYLKINYHLKTKKRITPYFRIPNVLIEFILPSLFIYSGIKHDNNFMMLDADGMQFYIILILLSSLHLDFKISVFAGFIAFIIYISFFHWGYSHIYHLDLFDFTDNQLWDEKMIFIGKSFSLLFLGVIAGFVGHEIKLRIIAFLNLQNERMQIERLFGQQVSKEIVDELINEKEQMHTKYVEASIMFLDIRDFTTFAGHNHPSEVIDYQNKIFSPLIEIITNYNGVVLQILGDGFMAAFGTPVKDINHTENAFKAGVSILYKINEMGNKETIRQTNIGIGLHTGKIITGNIGNNIRQQYSIAGKNVILAARLEQANKDFKTNYLISQEVYGKVKHLGYQFEQIENVNLKGFDQEIDIYSLKY